MSLPSRYAPEGLNHKDASKTIVINRRPSHDLPSKMVLGPIIRKASINEDIETEDIEMVSFDEDEEERTISHVLSSLRAKDEAESDQMEIDVFETAPPFTQIQIGQGNISYLIVDTNFMLAHLSVIDKLLQLAAEYQLRIIIPVTVMKELDGLKSSSRLAQEGLSNKETKGKSIGTLARWANNWIYSVLAKNHLYVRGQKLRQRLLPIHTTNDDSILDCCLYFYETNPRSIIVLLSNDKNLCAKALSNSILTISYQNEVTPEYIGSTVLEENINRYGHNAVTVNEEYKLPVAPIAKPIEANRAPLVRNSSSRDGNAVSIIANEIQIVLKSVIKHCMEIEYGDELQFIRDYDVKEITSLDDCAMTIIRFWLPVFSSYFRSSNIVPFENQNKSKSKVPIHTDIPRGHSASVEFVDFWSDVLTILYSQIMTERQNEDLIILENRWRALLDD